MCSDLRLHYVGNVTTGAPKGAIPLLKTMGVTYSVAPGQYGLTSELFIPAWLVRAVDDPKKATMIEERVDFFMPAACGEMYATQAACLAAIKEKKSETKGKDGKASDDEEENSAVLEVTLTVLVPNPAYIGHKNVELTRIDSRERDVETGKKRKSLAMDIVIKNSDITIQNNGPAGLKAMLANIKAEVAAKGGVATDSKARKVNKGELPTHLLT